MKKDEFKTKVIFRKFKDDGEIIAIFPEIIGDEFRLFSVLSYMHIGQHSAADTDILSRDCTIPVKVEEYQELFYELESLGYNLDVKKRYTYKMFQNRQKELNRMRGE